jgi:hypothetical protein
MNIKSADELRIFKDGRKDLKAVIRMIDLAITEIKKDEKFISTDRPL